jgi:hypothetical protein
VCAWHVLPLGSQVDILFLKFKFYPFRFSIIFLLPVSWSTASLSQRQFTTQTSHWGKFFGGKEAENVAAASPAPKSESVAPKIEEASTPSQPSSFLLTTSTTTANLSTHTTLINSRLECEPNR